MSFAARALIDFAQENGPRLSCRFDAPMAVLTAQTPGEVLPLLQRVETESNAGRWVAGFVGYEAAAAFDPALATQTPMPGLPLAAFAIYERCGDFTVPANETFSLEPWQADTGFAPYRGKIETIRRDIAAGNYYQTNLTYRLIAGFEGSAEALFHALHAAQPDGYAMLLDFGDWQIASTSPELFFDWNRRNGKLTTRPMKGTAPLANANTLQSDKNRAENLMIVDLLRNDMSRIADRVQVTELFREQNLSTVRQMVSTITAHTKPNTQLADIFTALFPCGSVTGAPKIAAMRAIRDLETSPRSFYCGALGIIKPGGDATFSVGIRGVSIMNGTATAGVGGGITWDSDAADEWAETEIKSRFLWRATAGFDLLETMRLDNGAYPLRHSHLARMADSAQHFGFDHHPKDIDAALTTLAKQNATGIFRVRLLSSRLGKVQTEIYPLEPNPEKITFQLAHAPINENDLFLRHKTTNRKIYDPFAPPPGVFDTLLYNSRGEITEFTRGNVVVEIDGRRLTPHINCGLLPGTLRAEMIARGQISEAVLSRDDLNRATRIWFINGLRRMIKARR